MKIFRFLLLIISVGLVFSACASPASAPTLPVVTASPVATAQVELPSPTTIPPTSAAGPDQSEALMAIRVFMDKPDLALTFNGSAHMPNSPNGDLQAWQFTDDTQRVYLVDTTTQRLLEIDPPPTLTHASVNTTYTESELQVQAEEYLNKAMPEFSERKASLTYQVGNKGEFFFFRWEDPQATGFTMMRPFAQVALSADGTLVSYYNTLILK